MFENLDIFRMSSAMAVHAGQKQAVVAQNVANADTPGYQARDMPSFQSTFEIDAGVGSQRATRARHLNGAMGDHSAQSQIDRSSSSSPDGNTVSLETEMVKSIDAKRQHDRALAIYKSALGMLRTSLGR